MYRIVNSEGKQGRAWNATYTTKFEAMVALRDAMGWEYMILAGSFETGHGKGWSAYPDEESKDADLDGAKAPRIEEVSRV